MIHCDCKIDNVYSKWTDEILDVNMVWCPLHGAAGELLEACKQALAFAESPCGEECDSECPHWELLGKLKAAIQKSKTDGKVVS